MSHKSIAVIGNGFVGGSLTTVFSERGTKVFAYDKSGKYVESAIKVGDSIKELVAHTESQTDFSKVYFVCVPTPMLEDGDADLSIVESVLKELAEESGNRIAVVKSTVPPGSTKRWNDMFNESGLTVIFSPEFLTEANALDDTRNQNRIILGGSTVFVEHVANVFGQAFPNVQKYVTSSTNAEMVKYVANIHLAVKVSLANEFYQICKALEADGQNVNYDKVMTFAKLDERLGKTHWQVPGPMLSDDTHEQVMGFAGSCFIKDINALMCLSKKLGVDPKVMSGAWGKNLEVRPQRDWEKLVGRAISTKK